MLTPLATCPSLAMRTTNMPTIYSPGDVREIFLMRVFSCFVVFYSAWRVLLLHVVSMYKYGFTRKMAPRPLQTQFFLARYARGGALRASALRAEGTPYVSSLTTIPTRVEMCWHAVLGVR